MSRLEQWQKRTRVISLKSGFEVVVRELDVLSMMNAGANGAPNPLMAIIAQHTSGKEADLGKAIEGKPEALAELARMLRELCLKAVVDPPLTENGHPPDESISVDTIPLEDKMEIFAEMMGGAEQVGSAEQFLQKEGASMVVAPNSKTILDSSESGSWDQP